MSASIGTSAQVFETTLEFKNIVEINLIHVLEIYLIDLLNLTDTYFSVLHYLFIFMGVISLLGKKI